MQFNLVHAIIEHKENGQITLATIVATKKPLSPDPRPQNAHTLYVSGSRIIHTDLYLEIASRSLATYWS